MTLEYMAAVAVKRSKISCRNVLLILFISVYFILRGYRDNRHRHRFTGHAKRCYVKFFGVIIPNKIKM